MTESSQRTVLITGCSSGIGRVAADSLRERDWRVFATCRQEADCERLREAGHESFRLDYEDPESIAEGFDETIRRTGGSLAALFNNGAYAIPAAVEDLPVAALRAIYEANLFGWHDLTRRVLAVMRAQGHGRIVQNSSVLGFVALPLRGAYVSTKFALEGLTDTLRLELHGTGIHVALIEPGPIATRFGINAEKQFHRWIDAEQGVFREQYAKYTRVPAAERPPSPHTLPPAAVVSKVIHALESARPKPRYHVTFPTRALAYLRRVLPTAGLDSVLRRFGS